MAILIFLTVPWFYINFSEPLLLGYNVGPHTLLTVALGPTVALAEGVHAAERVVAEPVVVAADGLVLVLTVDAALLHAVHTRQQGHCEQTKHHSLVEQSLYKESRQISYLSKMIETGQRS